MLCGMAIQAFKGYTRFELGLYLYDLFTIELVNYWLICALAIAIHAMVNNKYLGHFVMVVYYVLLLFASQLGLEHNLYQFGSVPAAVYSDMNGYGHFLPRVRSFQAYWGAASLLLLVLALLFWSARHGELLARAAGGGEGAPRRTDPGRGRRRAASPSSRSAASSSTTPTSSIPTRRPPSGRRCRSSTRSATRRWRPSRSRRSIAVTLAVDLYPREQRVRMKGRYALENKSGAAGRPGCCWPSLAAARLVVHQLDIGVPNRLEKDDVELGVRLYRLDPPLRAGREDDARLRPRAADARLHQRRREHLGGRQRHASSTAARCCR